MLGTMPRIGVLTPDAADAVRDAGGEPISLGLSEARPEGGIALAREWVADAAHISCARENPEALFVGRGFPEELTGLLLCALRLDLPIVFGAGLEEPFPLALAALGVAPLSADPVEVALEVARSGSPTAQDIVESFSLTDALRTGCSLGGGPEMIVHLAAISREAGVGGFNQTIRVIAPEVPAITFPGSEWFKEHGPAGLFSRLGDQLHDGQTVEGGLKELLPDAPPAPPESDGPQTYFVRGRSSGTEVVCRAPVGTPEISGECNVFYSEMDAVAAVLGGRVEPGNIVVVRGCGPRGGPGLLRLDDLRETLEESGPEEGVTVLSDGVAPDGADGTWISLFTPEAAVGGVIGRFEDGDDLRFDLEEKRIKTKVKASVMERRESYYGPDLAGYGYASRYAASALSAIEGAGFS